VGTGDPGATVTAPDAYALARALIGRRSRSQVADFDWVGEPAPYLGTFAIFPMSETDQVE